MVCGTCGSSGHNTTTCPRRKFVENVSGFIGGAIGTTVGGHVGHPHLGGYAGGQAGRELAKAGLETPAQREYRNRK
jgi:hypothetical protein